MNTKNRINRRRFLQGIAALSAAPVATLFPGTAFAAYPERPISMIVPWGAGGGADIVARTMSGEMERDLGRPINVVNRAGGGGVVGHSAIAMAPADGYTLGIATLEITLYKLMGLADITPSSFTPLARLGFNPGGVSVSASSPYKTIQELVTAIKAAPAGTFKASGAGVGSSWHINSAGFMRAIGLEPSRLRWVPSQGGTSAFQELIAGSVDMVTASPVEGRSMIEAGRVRPLVITNNERVAMFKNAPTMKEALGVDWQMSSWNALVGPKGLPAEASTRLVASAKKAHDSKLFGEMVDRGYVKIWETGAELDAFLRRFSASVEPLLRDLQLVKA
ncbi:MAG: tripartite tricarboxylate transporter substrate binding protein [Pseudomonadota bacterium]